MCSINRYQALVGGRKLVPSDMEFCPCLQVAGKYHDEFFSFWIEKNEFTKQFGVKEKHFSTEEKVLWQEGPDSELPCAVYLTEDLENVFFTPAGVMAPLNAIRVGWVSFPERVRSLFIDYADELAQWARACCASEA